MIVCVGWAESVSLTFFACGDRGCVGLGSAGGGDECLIG